MKKGAMSEHVLLAPDVFVNASVALKSAPEQVAQRILGRNKGSSKTSRWILERVESMLKAHPDFKEEAIRPQLETIIKFTEVVETEGSFGPDAWKDALVATAKAAGVKRVITDHPDLAEADPVDGIEFMSTEGWLLERTIPPPPPGG